ncbi:BQ2448_4157 [Microbotryum intermedium]|uniref:BQ2448_4157 protein n=1 Tax=Microbotryum intermedium TaxID=269621 RepID=A0A238FFN6_9BASI|nr:BQ2448_4157 [Microbotryum intermedium]
MGIWSPAAYDALLLEKIKTMLSSHLNSPKYATIRTTYEQFVLDLDVQDEGSKNAIKSLIRVSTLQLVLSLRHQPREREKKESNLAITTRMTSQETVVRRRLLPHSQPGHGTVPEPFLTLDPRSGALLGSTARSSAASTSNEPALQLEAASRAAANAWTTTAASSARATPYHGQRDTSVHAPSGPIISIGTRRSTTGPETSTSTTTTTTRTPRSPRVTGTSDTQTAANDDPRLSWQQFLSESAGGDRSTFETTLGSSSFIPINAPITSSREVIDLPSPTTARDSGYHIVNVPSLPARLAFGPGPTASSSTSGSASASVLPPPPPPRVANLRPPATAEQIWHALFDDVPFPLDDLVHIPFEVFLLSLNEVMDPPIVESTNFSNLCDELQSRDPGFNLRLRGVQRRQSASRLLYELRNVASLGGGGRDQTLSVEEATREDRERDARRREAQTMTADDVGINGEGEDRRRFREEMRGGAREEEDQDEEGESGEEEEEDALMSGPFFDPDFNYDPDMSDSQDDDRTQQEHATTEEDFRDHSSRLRTLLRRGADEWVQEVLRLEERTPGWNDRTENPRGGEEEEEESTTMTTTTTAATSTNTSPPPREAGGECPFVGGTTPRRPTGTISTTGTSAEIAEAAQRANRRIRPLPSRSQIIPSFSSSSTPRWSTTPTTDPIHGSTNTSRRPLRLQRVSGSGQTRWSWSDRVQDGEGEGEGEGEALYPRFGARTMTTGDNAEDDAGEDVYEGSRVFHL